VADCLADGSVVSSLFSKNAESYGAEFSIVRRSREETKQVWSLTPTRHHRSPHIRVLRVTQNAIGGLYYAQFTTKGEAVFLCLVNRFGDMSDTHVADFVESFALDIMRSDLLRFRHDIIRLLCDSKLPPNHRATRGSTFHALSVEGSVARIRTIYGAIVELKEGEWQRAYDEDGKFIE
jgi:hypothetical protein